jgi:hypothetical protein
MSEENMAIKKGPQDRMELTSAFTERRDVGFETDEGKTVRVRIHSLTHEDASGYSFMFEGTDLEDSRDVRGYYNVKRKGGFLKYV